MKAFITVLLLAVFADAKSQNKYFTLSVGYPQQLTSHWVIHEWKNHFNLKTTYEVKLKRSIMGVGINYSSFGFEWADFYVDPGKRNVSDISPYFIIGFNSGSKITFAPGLKIGYAFLLNNSVAPDKQIKGGAYLAPQLNLNYQVSSKFYLGIYSDFNMIFKMVDFKVESFGRVVEAKDKIYKYYTLGINLGYKW